MKEKKIYDAITNIDDELIENTEKNRQKNHKPRFAKIFAIAACAAIIIGSAMILPKMNNSVVDDDIPSQVNSEEQDISSDSSEISSTITPKPDLTKALATVTQPKAFALDDRQGFNEMCKNNPVDEKFYDSIRKFSCETAAELAKNSKDNLVYSPLSLYYALALTATGANGETNEEIMNLLAVDDKTYLSEQCRNLYNQLYRETDSLKFNIANSLWLNYKNDFEDEFIKNAADYYYSEVYHADFSSNETKDTMSQWVSNNTGGLIKPEFNFRGDELLTLFNTVYFNGEWIWDFDESKNTTDKFHLSDGAEIETEFMNGKLLQSYAHTEDALISNYNLKHGYKMIFALPNDGINARDIISSPEKIDNILTAMNSWESTDTFQILNGNVTWKIPKFDIKSKTDLKGMLDTLGMKKAFNDADFTGICADNAVISEITQDARIKVNEQGVEAAAFTMEIMTKGGFIGELIDVDMTLDKPFVYILTDRYNNICFIGICENPIK